MVHWLFSYIVTLVTVIVMTSYISAKICLQVTVRRLTRDVRRCGTPTFDISIKT